MAPPKPSPYPVVADPPVPPSDRLPAKVEPMMVMEEPWFMRAPPLRVEPAPPVTAFPRNWQLMMVAVEGLSLLKPALLSRAPPRPKKRPAGAVARLVTKTQLVTRSVAPPKLSMAPPAPPPKK